ncbi:hypothetical protein ACSFBC_17300 [Variovorax sp. LT1R16]
MFKRLELIALIQTLSAEEGTRQPTAADWLQAQDLKQRALNRPALEGRMRLPALFQRFPCLAL